MISIPIALKNTSDVPDSSFSEIRPELELDSFMFVPVCYTLCPNKSDQIADFLITCNDVYRIKHNFTYELQTIMQSFWKFRLSVTQK